MSDLKKKIKRRAIVVGVVGLISWGLGKYANDGSTAVPSPDEGKPIATPSQPEVKQEGNRTIAACIADMAAQQMRCPNPEGKPNPITVTVKREGSFLVFSAGKSNIKDKFLANQKEKGEGTIPTLDKACKVTIKTNPKEGVAYAGTLSCERPKPQSLAPIGFQGYAYRR